MKISNIVVAAIFLVLISLFSLNFEELTGYVPKIDSRKIPEVSIVDPIVDSGEKITVRVKINGYCIDPDFEILTGKGLHKDDKMYYPTEDDCVGQNFRSCRKIKYCVGDVKNDIVELVYKTQADFSGDYKVQVRYIEKPGQDQYDTPFVEAEFSVL